MDDALFTDADVAALGRAPIGVGSYVTLATGALAQVVDVKRGATPEADRYVLKYKSGRITWASLARIAAQS